MSELIADTLMKDFCSRPIAVSGNREFISLCEISVREHLFSYVYARDVSAAFITWECRHQY
jgi:hypothetical protein